MTRTLRLGAVLLPAAIVLHEVAYSLAGGGLVGAHGYFEVLIPLSAALAASLACAAIVMPALGAPGREPEPYAPFALAGALLAIFFIQELAEATRPRRRPAMDSPHRPPSPGSRRRSRSPSARSPPRSRSSSTAPGPALRHGSPTGGAPAAARDGSGHRAVPTSLIPPAPGSPSASPAGRRRSPPDPQFPRQL